MPVSRHACGGCDKNYLLGKQLILHCKGKPANSPCRKWYHNIYAHSDGPPEDLITSLSTRSQLDHHATPGRPSGLFLFSPADIEMRPSGSGAKENQSQDVSMTSLPPVCDLIGDVGMLVDRQADDEDGSGVGDEDRGSSGEDSEGSDSNATESDGDGDGGEDDEGQNIRVEDLEEATDLSNLFNEVELELSSPADNNRCAELPEGNPQTPRQQEFSQIHHSVYYEGAARDYGGGSTFTDKYKEDEFANYRMENPFYPFASRGEWEFTNILMRLHCSLSEKTELLNTALLSNAGLPYKTAQAAKKMINLLPSGPQWASTTISIDGYETLEPVIVYHRDAAECVEYLFNNPVFADHLDLVPVKHFDAKNKRVFSDPISGIQAWQTQDRLPEGATRLGVGLASDGTLLSSGTGDLQAHPVMMTLDNLRSNVRRNASNHAWLLLALLAKPRFPRGMDDDVVRTLKDRIFHKSLRLVLDPLMEVARVGKLMSDPRGRLRKCFTTLSMYMVDYPEAVKLAGVTYFTSPITFAHGRDDLGDPEPKEIRWKSDRRKVIEEVRKSVDPYNDIKKFTVIAGKSNVSGVVETFWDGWDHSEPSAALSFDLLHTSFKFWADHPFKWAVELVKPPEMDRRYVALHPRIGYRYFWKGVTALSKTGEKDHRDMQRYFLSVLDGAVPDRFMSLMRCQIEYTYIAQSMEVNEDDLNQIRFLLDKFHSLKEITGSLKLRKSTNGWRIPKLEMQHHIVRTITLLGGLLGLSTDMTENRHIQLVKEPFRGTNKKDFFRQMVNILDNLERLRHFDLATALHVSGLSDKLRASDTVGGVGSEHIQPREDDLEFLNSLGTIQNLRGSRRPEYRDLFAVVGALRNLKEPQKYQNRVRTFQGTSFTAIHLNRDPDIPVISIADAAAMFDLSDLRESIGGYLHSSNHSDSNQEGGPILRRCTIAEGYEPLGFDNIRIWFKIKLQTKSLLEPGRVCKPITVCAEPPSQAWPLGRCDCALFMNDKGKEFTGKASLLDHCVGQIRMVFQLCRECTSLATEPYLVYAQRFDCSHAANGASPISGLFRLKRAKRSGGLRLGAVVGAENIRCAVDVSPFFGKEVDPALESKTSLETSAMFNLNKYSDKELFFLLREQG